MNEGVKQALVAKYRDSYNDYLDDYLDKVKHKGLEVVFSVWVCMRLHDVSEECKRLHDTLNTIQPLAEEAEMNDRKTHYWKIYAPLFTKGETRLPFEEWLVMKLDGALNDRDYLEDKLKSIHENSGPALLDSIDRFEEE